MPQNPNKFTLTAGLTVVATFQRDPTTIPVTLHVGEGHADYAQQIADALNAKHGEGCATVGSDGTAVTYHTLRAQTLRNVASDLEFSVLPSLPMPKPGHLLGAKGSYSGYDEYQQDMFADNGSQLEYGLDLFLIS
jgi:hypothetical protein